MDPAFAEASGDLARTCAKLHALVDAQKHRLQVYHGNDSDGADAASAAVGQTLSAKKEFVAENLVRQAVDAYRQDLLKTLREQIAAMEGELAQRGAGLDNSMSDTIGEQREVKHLRQDLAEVQDKLEEIQAASDAENELQSAVRESTLELEKLSHAVRDGLRAASTNTSAPPAAKEAFVRQAELLTSLRVDAVPAHGDPIRAVQDELNAATKEMDEMLRHQEPETHRRNQDYQQATSRLDSLVRSCCPDYDRLNDPDVLTRWKDALHEAAKECTTPSQVIKRARAQLDARDQSRLQILIGLS
ncbi:Hypothetical Protein FCC1311_055742 [Hondaea fermentalgiana]|uniref:Uncharacterized protein n=1 Tax=Hondaea fermentalgiana TaxID=2315210 RepID=A0A2R5GEK6_9STRA|nr:Hypothetical Protein FCC1311_055742 [Hondaea fermentalgiana]|eukprot:GBG29352.1 Hypothetical Protein FCC1311_055742 [Hondaea fermentalgiana]